MISCDVNWDSFVSSCPTSSFSSVLQIGSFWSIIHLQAILSSKAATDVRRKLRIYDNEIEIAKSVKLLGVGIDYQIKFNKQISPLCSKALSINCKSIWIKLKKNAIIHNLIYSNFSYCLLVWHFCSYQSSKKPDPYLWLKISDLLNFAFDNTIVVTCNNWTSLSQTLEKESESAIGWLENSSMIANPDKFQAIILSKSATDVTHRFRIYDNEMETTKLKLWILKDIDWYEYFHNRLLY